MGFVPHLSGLPVVHGHEWKGRGGKRAANGAALADASGCAYWTFSDCGRKRRNGECGYGNCKTDGNE